MSGESDTQPSSSQTQSKACCTTVPEISVDELDDEVERFAALANPTRYGAVRLLVAADDEVCACNLAPPLDVTQSAISHALSQLHTVGLVKRRKDGRWRYYQATSIAEELIDRIDAHQEGDR
ncbi:ArsR/SmtB family transcription factor [Halocatena halophila]|uniref:ArsR/SmtB family transcription factor n=1 Tax=Halocatena halophila TaxID=2814576 RepID=UPI002ED06015